MASDSLGKAFLEFKAHALVSDCAGASDGELLDRFLVSQDEAAFAVLVGRHGPMILGVCRRILGNLQDAEDAFQATFLVLARKAAALHSKDLVGNWLYGVAYRSALRARTIAARRRAREIQVTPMPDAAAKSEMEGELLQLLDQEISHLPEKYRIPLVLCEIEGQSRKVVAGQLRLPEGTLSSRLAAGRKLLARRLARHIPSLTVGGILTVLTERATARVSSELACSTARMARAVAAGAMASSAIPAQPTLIMEGVLKTMLLTKLKIITACVLAIGVLALGTCARALYGMHKFKV